ncbi:MBL fold metallo-hydrolase [Calderihabitans maritimus]|uniref:Metallo-beta-lactamase domain-containing protein n=1 Tax=Calderihabitans maritimus TaxID=1246530 RepID=A0A1Z5HV02_9FIRM|nr:MBL fold metallo-hydrolase [Calderihabitans maritimus]GAW93356.1 hypothetical protein KKC1_24930 [Calderihabitans maritimus]
MPEEKPHPENFIKFLGTGGARFVQLKQLRSSGGTWIKLGDTNLMLDPGPGTLVRCWGSRPPLDPSQLDGVILSHRHLDHSNDLNVMVEAMTEGGFSPGGVVFAPADALEGPEPILFGYLRPFLDAIYYLKEGEVYRIKEVEIATPVRHDHPVETYGIKLSYQNLTVSFITDTRYFSKLQEVYKAEILVLNVTFVKPRHTDLAFHLSYEEVEPIINSIRPKIAVLTHFGSSMLMAKPWELANKLEKKTGVRTMAAYDGMLLSLDEFLRD